MDLGLVTAVDDDNPVDGDIRITSGDLVLVDDSEAIAQQVSVRLKFFLGEWFLNLKEGLPFFRDILVKNPSRALVSSVLKETILGTPGVSHIESFELELNHRTRRASLSFVARTDEDESLVFTNFDIFFVVEAE